MATHGETLKYSTCHVKTNAICQAFVQILTAYALKMGTIKRYEELKEHTLAVGLFAAVLLMWLGGLLITPLGEIVKSLH